MSKKMFNEFFREFLGNFVFFFSSFFGILLVGYLLDAFVSGSFLFEFAHKATLVILFLVSALLSLVLTLIGDDLD